MRPEKHKGVTIIILIMLALPVVLAAYTIDYHSNDAVFVSKDNDRETFTKPDGTIIYKYSNREEAILPDKTRIIKFSGGKKLIFNPDGVKQTIDPDGSMTCEYPDGKKKTFPMDGLTPYGMKIKGERRLINRETITVDIIYSAHKSDDHCDKNIRRFFDELAGHVQQLVADAPLPRNSLHWKIELSNCRFCKTGYCRREGREGVTLIFYRNFKEEKRTTYSRAALIDSSSYERLVIEVSKSITFQ